MKKPTVGEIQSYLDRHDILGLRGAGIKVVSERNHLIYRVERRGKIYALRMINPESHRKDEWISMAEEYAILKAVEPAGGIGPKVYYLDEEFSPPFLIQEFVTATCFNDLKPLREEHLEGAARAIALLNSLPLSPRNLPFLKKYEARAFQKRLRVWHGRLFYACVKTRRPDVWRWTVRIIPLLWKAWRVLFSSKRLAPQGALTFHLDSAHCGNTYWRDEEVVFLDWQKVSLRDDPTFTLVRFLTSVGEKGEVPESVVNTMVRVYLRTYLPTNITDRGRHEEILRFERMVQTRLLERQVSDLVWVLWEYARRKDQRPVEEGTSVMSRYGQVKTLLRLY